jgi:transposase-like protein
MTKRQFKPEAKYRILEEARQPGTSVAEVCRRHQIASSLFYKWEAEARKGALEALDNKKRQGDNGKSRESELEAKLSRMRAVISEITEENLQLKKTLGD